MPLFFFHIRAGSSLAEDPDGIDLPNLEVAYAEAMAMARELAADDLRVNKPARSLSIEISNGAGQILKTLSVSAAINNTSIGPKGVSTDGAKEAGTLGAARKIHELCDEILDMFSQNQALLERSRALIAANRAIYSENQQIMHNIMCNIVSARHNLRGS